MDSNLIITGPIAKYYDVYQSRKDKDGIASPHAKGLLRHIRDKSSVVATNMVGLAGKLVSHRAVSVTNAQKRRSETVRDLVPIRHGDIIFISPVMTDDGSGICMMCTTTTTQRTCVQFWKTDAVKANPYAGFYVINKANYDTRRGHQEPGAESNDRGAEIIKQGEAVTLQLLLASKYLNAEMGKFADIEKNFIKLGVCDKQNDLSVQFSIRTRYNCSLGSSVYYNEQVYLTHEVTGLEIHMGERTSTYGSSFYSYGLHRRVEVNLGQLLESNDSPQFYWTIKKYCSAAEWGCCNGDLDVITVGCCVSIHCPHKDAYLWGSNNSRVFDKFGPKSSDARVKKKYFRNKSPEFVFGTYQSNMIKTAFVVESVNSLRGGHISRDALFRLRHLTSNTYLCVERSDTTGALVTTLTNVTDTAGDKDRSRHLFSSLFQLQSRTSIEDMSSFYLTSKSTFLHIFHPIVTMHESQSHLRYDETVEQLLAGNFSINRTESVALTMGSSRERKKREYMHLICDDAEFFHIPPPS